MKKLICPDNLSYDWQMGSVPLVHSFTDLRNLQSAALTAIVVGIFLQLFQRYFASVYTKLKVESSVRGLAFSILFLVVPFLPASNIFFQVGFVAAERILYVPSIGFCVLVALGASKLYASVPSWLQKSFQIVLLVSLTSFAAKTFTRNFAWNSKFSLFRSGLQSTQNNAKIFYNYGNMARENGNSETAKLCYKEAIRLWPSYVIAWNNLATLSDNETEIEQLLRKALLLDPSHTTSLFNLADLYRQRHEYRKAVYYFSICLKFRECQHNRAGVLLGECKQQIKLNSKKTQKQQFATMDKTKELYR